MTAVSVGAEIVDITESFGAFLYKRRKNVNLTLVDVSKKSEINSGYISLMENAKVRTCFKKEKVIRLCNALKMSESEISDILNKYSKIIKDSDKGFSNPVRRIFATKVKQSKISYKKFAEKMGVSYTSIKSLMSPKNGNLRVTEAYALKLCSALELNFDTLKRDYPDSFTSKKRIPLFYNNEKIQNNLQKLHQEFSRRLEDQGKDASSIAKQLGLPEKRITCYLECKFYPVNLPLFIAICESLSWSPQEAIAILTS